MAAAAAQMSDLVFARGTEDVNDEQQQADYRSFSNTITPSIVRSAGTS